MANYQPTGTANIYRKSSRLYYRVKVTKKGKDGADRIVWTYVASNYSVGQEQEAFKALDTASRAAKAEKTIFRGKKTPTTVEEYGAAKFFPRRVATVKDHKRDEERLRLHIFPFEVEPGVRLGGLPLREVQTHHVRDCVLALRGTRQSDGTGFAPRTVYNAYFVLKALFRDAEVDGLVGKNPCMLDDRDLGKKRDKTSGWRETAIYERDELELLISSPLIPFDRQLWYAFEGIGAMRLMEVAATKFEHYFLNDKPLGRLLIPDTKTGFPRNMPVHPVLAAMLAEWHLRGWTLMMGRHPQPGDLILPTCPPTKGKELPAGLPRTQRYVWGRLKKDLQRLGMRHRRSHDLRATFINLALDDGGSEYHLEACTHTPKSAKAFDMYKRIRWTKKCEAVGTLKIQRGTQARGELISLNAVGNAPTPGGVYPTGNENSHLGEHHVPRLYPESTTTENNSENTMRAEGIEPSAPDIIDDGLTPSDWQRARNSAHIKRRRTEADSSERRSPQAAGYTGTSGNEELSIWLATALDEWVERGDREGLRAQLAKLLQQLGSTPAGNKDGGGGQ